MHGQDAAGNELSVLPDVKVPRLDPHQVVKSKLQYQTTLCANLDGEDKLSMASSEVRYLTPTDKPDQTGGLGDRFGVTFRRDSDNIFTLNFPQGRVTSAIMLQIFIPFRTFLAFGTMQLFVKCEKYNLEKGVCLHQRQKNFRSERVAN